MRAISSTSPLSVCILLTYLPRTWCINSLGQYCHNPAGGHMTLTHTEGTHPFLRCIPDQCTWGNTSNMEAGAALGAPQQGWAGLQNSMVAAFLWASLGGCSVSILWTLPSVGGQGLVLSRVLPWGNSKPCYSSLKLAEDIFYPFLTANYKALHRKKVQN